MFSKLAFLCLTLTILNIATRGQQPCSKTLAESPALAGFKLGASIEETKAALGSYKIPKKKTGEGSYFENFADRPAAGKLSGIHALFLRFFDQKLYQIEIFYEDSAKPARLDGLSQTLSSDLNLPADSWKFDGNRAEMNCGDFVLTADTILNPHVELTDDAAYKQFQEKQRATKKKKGK